MTKTHIRCLVIPVLLTLALTGPARAKTSNGNDFALYYSEAQTKAEQEELFSDAKGRPHFFRYLQIMDMEEGKKGGTTYVRITAFEPSSYFDVRFTVSKSVSLRILAEDPKSEPGKAIAVTGKVVGANHERGVIELDTVIVRYKDRLSPKIGKELLCEVDPRATFYSYTGGKKIVSLTYKDRDLLKHEQEIVAKKGKQGWADFLEQEVAKRNRARAAKKGSGR